MSNITMPNSFLEELNHANMLMREGKFQEALEITNSLEKKSTLAPGDQLTLLILKGKIYTFNQKFEESVKIGKLSYRMSQSLGRINDALTSLLIKANCAFLGQFDKALGYLLKAEELLNSLTDISPSYISRQRANILYKRGYANQLKGNLSVALETALECLPLQQKLGRKVEIAYTLSLLGDIYYAKGDNDIALDYAMRSKTNFEEIGDKIGLTTSLRALGMIYLSKGDLDNALKYSKKSFSSKVIGTQTKLDSLQVIGDVYIARGELDKALKYYKQGIPLAEKENAYFHFVQFQTQIGTIYMMKRDFDLATEYLKTGLLLAEKINHNYAIFIALIFLIFINVEKGSHEEAQKNLNQIKELEKTTGSKLLSHGYFIAKAYLLKTGSGSRNRAEAERLLKQVVKEETHAYLRAYSLIYLCEFYLEEVNLYEDIELIKEVNPLLIQLLKLSEEQRMYGFMAEAKLLQAKVALIRMDFEEAQRLLTQAQRVAEMYGIKFTAQKISSEHDNYLDKLSEWKNLKEREAPISERLKLASIDEVLERLQGKREIEPPELVDEEPIVLLIMDKSGISYFNYPFREDWDVEWLFSSFMSAFNTFSSELFSESIDRIKIGENIILINPIESFLVCYVIKGQSYLGLQKLNRFSNAIKENSEIWETLNRAVQTGEVLELDKPQSLGIVINEIFA
jgi:tetratricopeptide (TPR) repeat protein